MVTMAATASKLTHRGPEARNATRRPLAGAIAACAAALAFAPGAQAIDWRLTPSVGARAIYSDNVRQSATDPEHGLSLSVTPGFSLRSEGSRRVQAVVQYGLTAVTRFGGNDGEDLFHNLSAAGKAELVEDFLFVDASARISQELISLLGSPAGAEVNDSNRATVGTYSISPYIQQRFGTFADAQLRYTASGAIFENDVAATSASNSVLAALTSGTRFNDLSWGLNYSLRKVENRNAENVTFERATATAGYALTRKFRVFGSVGQDWNDYLSTTGTDGSSYSVGFGWAPSRRASMEASVGERYFGNTFGLSGNYRARRSNWNVRYAEDVSDITQQFLRESNRIFWVCGGMLFETDGLDPPPGQSGCTGPITAGQLANFFDTLGVSLSDLIAANLLNIGTANGIFVIKSFTASVSWNFGRLGFGLAANDTRRLYQLFGDAEDRVQSVSGSANYRLSPKTTANSGISLTRTRVDGILTGLSNRENDTLTMEIGLNHRFAEKLNGALSLRHIQRDANDSNADYDENRLTASVNMRF